MTEITRQEAHNLINRAETALQMYIKRSENSNDKDQEFFKKGVKEMERNLELCLLRGIYLNLLKK